MRHLRIFNSPATEAKIPIDTHRVASLSDISQSHQYNNTLGQLVSTNTFFLGFCYSTLRARFPWEDTNKGRRLRIIFSR